MGGAAIDTPTFTPKILSFRHVKNVLKNILFQGLFKSLRKLFRDLESHLRSKNVVFDMFWTPRSRAGCKKTAHNTITIIYATCVQTSNRDNSQNNFRSHIF